MSYKAYEFRAANRAAFWAAIQPFMGEIGWEEYDVIDADTIVYRSNGESGKEPYGYIHIDAGTSTYIEFTAYQYWNLATHTGTRKMWAYNAQANSRITVFGDTYPGFILAGDKDLVFMLSYAEYYSATSVGYGVIFGHLPIRFDTRLTNAEGTAGTAGTITVESSVGFGVGKYVQIVGGTTGCDLLQITEIVDTNTIKVTSLARNYGTGAVLGSPGSTFGIVSVGGAVAQRWFQTSFYGDSGTTVGSSYLAVGHIASPTVYTNMMHFTKKFHFAPFVVATDSASSPGIILGCYGTNFMYGNYNFGYEFYVENNDGSAPEVGRTTQGGTNTLKDSRKSWTVNEHAGKFVTIMSGVYAYQGGTYGMSKKIASNTEDTLTLVSDWNVVPDGTTIYVIHDILWRATPAYTIGQNYSLIRITDTTVPS